MDSDPQEFECTWTVYVIGKLAVIVPIQRAWYLYVWPIGL